MPLGALRRLPPMCSAFCAALPACTARTAFCAALSAVTAAAATAECMWRVRRVQVRTGMHSLLYGTTERCSVHGAGWH